MKYLLSEPALPCRLPVLSEPSQRLGVRRRPGALLLVRGRRRPAANGATAAPCFSLTTTTTWTTSSTRTRHNGLLVWRYNSSARGESLVWGSEVGFVNCLYLTPLMGGQTLTRIPRMETVMILLYAILFGMSYMLSHPLYKRGHFGELI